MSNNPDELLQLAYRAAAFSRHPVTQLGAVLADQESVLLAYNDEPARGMLAPQEWGYSAVRDDCVLHPEASLLVKTSQPMTRPTLAVTLGVCSACARLIAASKVVRVVVHDSAVRAACGVLSTPDQEEFSLGSEILRRAQVEVIRYEGPIHEVDKVRLCGRLWCPSALAFVP